MSFPECVMFCFNQPELVHEFNRLTGCSLGIDKRSGLELMIDEATGHIPNERDYEKFIAFVWECVWARLPEEAFK